ncbi:alginate export family protein [Terrimonas sp. NA20]|uniref:Alginate export family protein n=1 Tax=Terrimonas ginsenosidimutans TaxID=2908004 RepID=A0ABS9KMF6_9BACT|nr:alginate export family protein [Terrimonas ginsenosidimutans]MCG2613507.1 alginate export family protein [Terrimonas ginsenosidimutans]
MRIKRTRSMLMLTACIISITGKAQLSLSGQLRTRTEWRDGQGAPLSRGQRPAVFTSQRSRLGLLFNTPRIKTNLTFQDVRVWGQDASMINRTTAAANNGFMLHEAWAEIVLSDTASKKNPLQLKLGRQELIYDDQRLLGNLDWLQQGRRHDAAVLKYTHERFALHTGGAFNQNKEQGSGTVYDNTPPGAYTASTNGAPMYKSMEFLHASLRQPKGKISLLFFADQFNTYLTDTAGGNISKTLTTGSWSRFTTGIYLTHTFNTIELSASAYHQFGKNGFGKKINGRLFSIAGSYNPGRLSVGAGTDITTPQFDPLYGTPHKFWGLMDYFYAGSLFGNNGLADYYIKTKIKTSDRLLIAADFHQFSPASSVAGYSRSYGQETDIVATYTLTKEISFEAGYSHFFSDPLLSSPAAKNIVNAKSQANWAYLMINIKPSFLFK